MPAPQSTRVVRMLERTAVSRIVRSMGVIVLPSRSYNERNMRGGTLTLLLLTALCASAQNYDLLLKGGHVIDAKNGINGIRDVAIAGGKIAAVASSIPDSQ